jgi:hypothetical protein
VNKIAEAKALLEENEYLVVRCSEPGWEEKAIPLNDEWIAIRLQEQNRGEVAWIKPRKFCKLFGVERHTLARHLKQEDCPKVGQKRGPKGRRLLFIQPTQDLVTFLRRNKPSS